jgi:hypothetical protein
MWKKCGGKKAVDNTVGYPHLLNRLKVLRKQSYPQSPIRFKPMKFQRLTLAIASYSQFLAELITTITSYIYSFMNIKTTERRA